MTFFQKIAKAIILAAAHLPLWVLYLFSDFASFMLYRVVRYRRKIVIRNLTTSFPEMTPKEIRKIARGFYSNFADYIVETLRYATISERKIRRRMIFENLELIDSYLRSGRPVVAYFSHCFNWEWVTLMGEHFRGQKDVQLVEVYRPLKNKLFDRLLLDIRTRFNTRCFPKSTVFRDLIRLRAEGVATCTGFMSDQKPSHGDRVHIIRFLNHPTAVITGTEIVGRKLQAAAVYLDMTRISRGHYHLRVVPMCDNVAETADFEMTDKYFRLLETNIRRQPDIWLWSHNRWKYPVEIPDAMSDNQSLATLQ